MQKWLIRARRGAGQSACGLEILEERDQLNRKKRNFGVLKGGMVTRWLGPSVNRIAAVAAFTRGIVTHHPRLLVARPTDYESGGQEFESLRARQ